MSTRAWAWKELREQGPLVGLVVAVSLASAGALGYWAASSERPLRHSQQLPWIVAVLIGGAALSAALVGAATIAGERENGTLALLEQVTGGRAAVWRAKSRFAILATLAAAGCLLGALLIARPDAELVLWAAALTASVLAASLFFSAFARSTLTACGLMVAAMIVSALGLGLAISWVSSELLSSKQGIAGWTASLVMLSLVAAGAGRWIYVGADAVTPARAWPKWLPWPTTRGTLVALWLVWRQRAWLLILAPLALFVLTGLSVPRGDDAYFRRESDYWVPLEPDLPLRVFYGPLAMLLLGVAAGVAAFGGDTRGDARQLWADARLPAGRIWATKLAYWMVWALFTWVICSGWLLREGAFESTGFSVYETRLWGIPGIALATGVSTGVLGAMCVRKSIAAFVLALIVSVPLAAVWLPSLMMRDFRPVWALAPAALLLVIARGSVWSWVSGTLAAPRAKLRIALGCTTLLALIAGVLAYRAWSVPAPPAAVLAQFPEHWTLDIATRNSVERVTEELLGPTLGRSGPGFTVEYSGYFPFAELLAAVDAPTTPAWRAWMMQAAQERLYHTAPPRFDALLPETERRPFPAKDLDNHFTADVTRQIAAWPTLPRSSLKAAERLRAFDDGGVRTLSRWLLFRDLELVERGDLAEALDMLLGTLALTRWQRLEANVTDYEFAMDAERIALAIFDRWLQRQVTGGPNERLLARAAEGLAQHQREAPPPRTVIDGDWLRWKELGPRTPLLPGGNTPQPELLWDLIWLAPWEAQRRERIVEWAFDGWYEADDQPHPLSAENLVRNHVWAPSPAMRQSMASPDRFRAIASETIDGLTALTFAGQAPTASTRSGAHVRGLRLTLACVQFRAQHGRYPTSLAELVPEFVEPADLARFELVVDGPKASLVDAQEGPTSSPIDEEEERRPAIQTPMHQGRRQLLYPLPTWPAPAG